MSSVTSSKENVMQNFRLIWLDSNINETDEDFRRSITQLKYLVNPINTYNDIDQCIDFLTSVLLEKMFLIVSDNLIQSIVSFIHDISQLNGIFVISKSEEADEQWTDSWSKVKGIFSDVDSICISLKRMIHLYDLNTIPISLISVDHTLDFNLNKFDQSLMCTQIIKEILFQSEYDEQSVKDFFIYCKSILTDNDLTLNKILKFQEEYRLRSPVWWYTSENFIRSMLNQALRTQQVKTIMKMSFFISDLHQEITKLHSTQFSDKQQFFTVYRGQSLSNDDLKKVMECKGGLISFNNFLSTSEDRQVALVSTENHRNNDHLRGILFQIIIDTRIATTPYARIDEFTGDNDKREVLFSMHAVFHIENIKMSEKDSSRFWIAELKMTSNNEPLLKVLTKRLRQETEGASGWHRLGQLLLKLDQFHKAEEVYSLLVDQCMSNKDEEAILFNQLGHIKQKQGDYITAIQFYDKALDTFSRIQPTPYPRMIDTYNNIGLMLLELQEYSRALPIFVKMLTLEQTVLHPDHPTLAYSHTKIGYICDRMDENSTALKSYKKALQIFKKTLRPDHPDLAVSHNLIADVYNKMGDYSEAFSYYQKGLEIKHKMVSSDQPNVDQSSDSIASLHSDEHQISTPTQEKEQSSRYSDQAISYSEFGDMYDKLGEHSKALFYCEMALEICHTRLPTDHPALFVTYHSIGKVYYSMHEDSKAFTFYQKALDMEEKIPAANREDLAALYNSIGKLYIETGEYLQSLLFCKKALDIQEKILPSNDLKLVRTCSTIASAYKNMGDSDSAAPFLMRAVSILTEFTEQRHLDA